MPKSQEAQAAVLMECRKNPAQLRVEDCPDNNLFRAKTEGEFETKKFFCASSDFNIQHSPKGILKYIA